MQHNKINTSEWVCAATTFFMSSAIHAGIPPINITLSSGTGTNIISIEPGQTTIVEYQIQDVIGRPPGRTWLWTTPIPAYMSRTASLHQPDCSVYNQNPAIPQSFTLPPNGSCYFAMEVNGTVLANTPTPTTYKPIFSNSGAVAYGPCDELQLSSTPASVVEMLLSAGRYNDPSIQRPLLVSSRDGGDNWIYPNAIPSIPPTLPFVDIGVIRDTSCTGTTCIAAGSGEDSNLHFFPLLAVSQDSLLTWNYNQAVSSPVFTPDNTSYPYIFNGRLEAASCSGNICITGGQYQSLATIVRPLLAVSQDKGQNWRYPTSITAPEFVPDNTTNPYNSGGNFNTVSCNGPLCVAAGRYFSANFDLLPLLALSQNAGDSWSYPSSIPALVFTPFNINGFQSSGQFFGASCSGNSCVTVGSYTDVNNLTRPLLAFTMDSGNNWTYPTPVTAPNIQPAFSDGSFNNVSCTSTTCVASGRYNDTLFTGRPLLAVSKDNGATWTFPASIPTPTFTPANTYPFQSGYFNNSNCSQELCIAVGTYTDTSFLERPLLALSKDGGLTWNYPEEITNPNFFPNNSKPYVSTGLFNAASCQGNSCLASGLYISDDAIIRPLLVFTKDGGNTWTYPEQVTTPIFSPINEFPFDLNGLFFTGTASSTGFLPKDLEFLYKKKHHL